MYFFFSYVEHIGDLYLQGIGRGMLANRDLRSFKHQMQECKAPTHKSDFCLLVTFQSILVSIWCPIKPHFKICSTTMHFLLS